jgi:hypothetical protein
MGREEVSDGWVRMSARGLVVEIDLVMGLAGTQVFVEKVVGGEG